MTAPISPPRPRPTWREPRFVLGLVLVVASAVGVAVLVTAADRTQQAFVVRHPVAAGDELSGSDLRPVRVRLGTVSPAYLASPPRPGTITTRTLARGELVPLAALSAAAAREQTSVVIAATGALPSAVATGAAVDVWAAEPSGESVGGPRFEAPRVLAPSATVVRVDGGSALGSGGGTSVEVRVPKRAAATLIAAIANGAAITLLPAAG